MSQSHSLNYHPEGCRQGLSSCLPTQKHSLLLNLVPGWNVLLCCRVYSRCGDRSKNTRIVPIQPKKHATATPDCTDSLAPGNVKARTRIQWTDFDKDSIVMRNGNTPFRARGSTGTRVGNIHGSSSGTHLNGATFLHSAAV